MNESSTMGRSPVSSTRSRTSSTLREVMDRSAARVAIDAERVIEDGVSANGLDPELVVDDAECLGELGTHVVPAGSGAPQQQREMLGTDHRAPGR